jgi:hypothetical protein
VALHCLRVEPIPTYPGRETALAELAGWSPTGDSMETLEANTGVVGVRTASPAASAKAALHFISLLS